MEKLRPFMAAVLGLTLWVQGLAIAAAPVAVADAASAADPAMEMPCHGDEPASVSPCDCCDGDCGGMMGCATGSVAGAPSVSTSAALPLHVAIATRGWSAQTAVPSHTLRPPIAFHA
ncbi:MAG: hypothetical protein ACT4PK_09140 [Gammaproteobacteria bacterium]